MDLSSGSPVPSILESLQIYLRGTTHCPEADYEARVNGLHF